MSAAGFEKVPLRYSCGESNSRLSDVLQASLLAHGLLTANHYGIGINDPVADSIRQKRAGQFVRPYRNVKLGAENRGVSLVLGLHDLKSANISKLLTLADILGSSFVFAIYSDYIA